VQRLAETAGRMTQDDLVSWGLAPARRAGYRDLGDQGLAGPDPNRKNARYVTPALQKILGDAA
jgi:hypothetical protein